MSLLVNRICSFALLAVMGGAVAEAAQQATFRLPFPARWGRMELAPGTYKLELPQFALGVREFRVSGDDVSGFVIPLTTDVQRLALKPSDRSFIRLVKVDGVFFVDKYQSGTSGMIFNFPMPRPSHKVKMSAREVVDLDTSGTK